MPGAGRRYSCLSAATVALCAAAGAAADVISTSGTGYTGAEVRLQTLLSIGSRVSVRFKGAQCSGVRFGLSLVVADTANNEEHEIALAVAQEHPAFSGSVTTWNSLTGSAQTSRRWALTGIADAALDDLTLGVEWRTDGVSFLAAGSTIVETAGGALSLTAPGMLSDALYSQQHRLHVYALPVSSRPPNAACLPTFVSVASVQYEVSDGAGGFTTSWTKSSFTSSDLGSAADWRAASYTPARVGTSGAATPILSAATVSSSMLQMRVAFLELTSPGADADSNPEFTNATLTSWTVATDGSASGRALYDPSALSDLGIVAVEVRNTGNKPESIIINHTVALAADTAYCTLVRVRLTWTRSLSVGILAGSTLVANTTYTLPADQWNSKRMCFTTGSSGADALRLSLGSHSGVVMLHPHVIEVDYAHTLSFQPQSATSPPTWAGTELVNNYDFSSTTISYPWVIEAGSSDWSVAVSSGTLRAVCSTGGTAMSIFYKGLAVSDALPYRLTVLASLTTTNPTSSPSTSAPTVSPTSASLRRRLLQTTSGSVKVVVRRVASDGTATSACAGQSVMPLAMGGGSVQLQMTFDCPLAATAGNGHELMLEAQGTFAQGDVLVFDTVSLQQWSGTAPTGPALPFSPADDSRSNSSANPFSDRSSTAQDVVVVAPFVATPVPLTTQAPAPPATIEDVLDERYSHRLVSFYLEGLIPQQVAPMDVRNSLATILSGVCPACASSTTNNVKLLRICRYNSADFPYLPIANRTPDYDPELAGTYSYDCRGLHSTAYEGWVNLDPVNLTSSTNITKSVEVTAMLVNLNPPQGTTVVQVVQALALNLEQLASTGGSLGSYKMLQGAPVQVREPSADPRPVTPVPTPAPRRLRSALADDAWVMILVLACAVCTSVGCATAHIALKHQDDILEQERQMQRISDTEGVGQHGGNSPRASVTGSSEPFGTEPPTAKLEQSTLLRTGPAPT
eukprot:TRINITY_DN1765_c4_g1_i1.p1 TRINITY_DN1765_c4_g1~~TRINITY_DN1765_c4_g1_i1.p1  ORF type:complete len:995 (+),score=313.11 TRINITY_DN1765_c4_g1_i1:79-2985(+)